MVVKRDLSEVLAGLSVEEMSVDEEGRVTIRDPEIARRLRDAVGAAPVTATAPNQTSCSSNDSNCSPNLSQCGGIV
ncbi:hypothetical protein [Planomonospora venezuelensis]|uniref:Uncharacterized protein n=1 Tax=Planomonospora venezuelensis TaxID=1999 RepID=A0A841CTG6_PLAVE|nr:hypothetical protein [Planomonospora venezuelensis]MBB5961712.1 hypothetical protein [Planomonospora venezuelensis]GIM98859.1 hypothetical protein Pve01_05180 [Planomonospora venezuelensis]